MYAHNRYYEPTSVLTDPSIRNHPMIHRNRCSTIGNSHIYDFILIKHFAFIFFAFLARITIR